MRIHQGNHKQKIVHSVYRFADIYTHLELLLAY